MVCFTLKTIFEFAVYIPMVTAGRFELTDLLLEGEMT